MPGRRFVAMTEGWLDNPVLKDGPFNRRCAWAWLIEEAQWRDRGDLKRGQLRHSLRFMGRAWGWRKDKVARFLRELSAAFMITSEAENATAITVITICNYEKYQDITRRDATVGATATRQQRDSNATDSYQEEDSSGSKEPSEGSLRSQRTRARAEPADFADWWEVYPHKVGKRAAEIAYGHALARARARASPAALIEGVRRYIATKPPDRQWCNPATFLNQDRWLDEPAAQPKILLPLNGGHANGRRQSPAEKLYAGFAAAAGFDSGPDRPPDDALLDRRRSA